MWKNRKEQLKIYLKIMKNDNRRYKKACDRLLKRINKKPRKRFAKCKIKEMTLDEKREYKREYYKRNKEKMIKKVKLYNIKNKNKIKIYQKIYQKNYRKVNEISIKINRQIRSRRK